MEYFLGNRIFGQKLTFGTVCVVFADASSYCLLCSLATGIFWQTQCRLTILVLGDGGVLFYEDHSWLENIALLSLLAAFVNNNFCHFCWSLVWVASSSFLVINLHVMMALKRDLEDKNLVDETSKKNIFFWLSSKRLELTFFVIQNVWKLPKMSLISIFA